MYEDQIFGDRQNGIVFLDTTTTPEELQIVWADNTTYVANSVEGPFTGTMQNDRLHWGSEEWVVQSLTQGQYSQELIQTGLIQERYDYNWTQEGILQGFLHPSLYGVGLNLYQMGTSDVVATFDLDSQELRWTNGSVWTRHGAPLQLSAQALRWMPGQSSVLYVHFEGSLRPDNSTGPQPLTSTCVGKISLDPNAQINHAQIARNNRFSEIAPGTLDQVKFRCANALGETVDLLKQGCSISMVVTLAPRGSG